MKEKGIKQGAPALPTAGPVSTIQHKKAGGAKQNHEIRKLVGKLAGQRADIQIKITRLEEQRRRLNEELIGLLTEHPKASTALRVVQHHTRRYPIGTALAILQPHFGPATLSLLGEADSAAVTKMLATLPDKLAADLRAALDTAGIVTVEPRLRAFKRAGSWN